jgi:hypothetical protein
MLGAFRGMERVDGGTAERGRRHCHGTPRWVRRPEPGESREDRIFAFLSVRSSEKGKVPIFAFSDHVLIGAIID